MTAVAARLDPKVSMTQILRDLCALDDDHQFTVGEIIDRFGRRSFGALMFLFAIPNILPLPPGATAITGIPLLLLAPQVAFGARTPWLPRIILDRKVKGGDLDRLFGKILPKLEKVERLSRPRHTFLFGPVGDRVIGVVCAILALILILPIPFMNVVPTLTIGVFSLALFNRDGVLAIIGYGLTIVSAGLLVAGYSAVVAVISKAMHYFSG